MRNFTDTSDPYVEPVDVGEERARELYQYYRPTREPTKEAVYLPYPDPVLQAHAQLAACRFDVQRAIIGLVDKHTTYFVAEATRTLDLEDNSQSEKPDDGLWYGRIRMPKRGGLLEWTLAQEPRQIDGEDVPAHLEILDMSEDPKWKDSKFVTAEPHYRYYCGLPLRTENDINIGALFLLDDAPRHPTSLTRLRVLYTLANNIMAHMKTVKEAHDKQRAVNMNICMADFISPEYQFRSWRRHRSTPPHHGLSNVNTGVITPPISRLESVTDIPSPRFTSDIDYDLPDGEQPESPHEISSHRPPKTPTRGNEQRGRRTKQDTGSGTSSPSPPPVKKDLTGADHQRTFDRAAFLLRQALDLSHCKGGGVVLFDTNAMADSVDAVLIKQDSEFAASRERNFWAQANLVHARTLTGHDSTPRQSSGVYKSDMREKVVLAAASIHLADDKKNASPRNYGRADSSFRVTLAPPELARMCKKHPRGKLYNIPENVGLSLFDWEGRSISGRLSSQLFELVLLHRQFPDAKQVIFVPMFHAHLNRWTSCFAYTNSRYRVFDYEMDYLPTVWFCNAVKAEIARLATVFADQQKGDFIGSVSHELRSPLHGILASIEFLQDTDCDAFQKTCITTMDACAHTLLDTVAMVLDYNKVNKLKHQSSRSSIDSAPTERHEAKLSVTANLRDPPLMATEQECDVAFITEEVIDGLATGHLSKYRTSTDLDDFTTEFNPTLGEVMLRPNLRRILNAVRPEVELILDIQAATDWTFLIQPGAIRRIVMNLFSNSLKYTKHGYITVSLRLQAAQSHKGDQSGRFAAEDKPVIVKLVVTDTGQGISPEYLRTKIFTPFAQENAKSTGTGLGLSIVRSIVDMMHGEIDIKSIVNVGTVIIVTMPLRRAKRQTDNMSGSPTCQPGLQSRQTPSGTHPRPKDGSVISLQSLPNPPQTAIYEPALELDSFGQTQGAAAVHSALVQYLSNWYGFPTLKTWDFDLPAKFLIVDEIHLPTLLARRPGYLDTLSLQNIIILCANPARQSILSRDIRSSQVELVSKPFGPYKLARAICLSLEKAAKRPTMSQHVGIIRSPPSTGSTPSTRSAWCYAESAVPIAPKPSHPEDVHLQRSEQGMLHVKEVSASSNGGFPFRNRLHLGDPTSFLKSEHEALAPSPPSPMSLGAERNFGFLSPSPTSHARPGDDADEMRDLPKDRGAAVFNSSGSTLSIRERGTSSWDREPRLLLVDDNRLNLELLHTFMKRKGYGGTELCKTAEDGSEAVDAFEAFTPDIVFMDLSMPVMDGLEATRNIRQIERKRRASDERKASLEFSGALDPIAGHSGRRASQACRPALVVALTGNAKGSDRAEALESGIDVYMTKPVSFKAVGKLIDDWKAQQGE